VLLAALVAPATAAADRPAGWMFRATPGFGYAWDRETQCPLEGRMFVGGFVIGNFVTPSLHVGGGTGIGFNALPAGNCPVDDALRLTTSFVFGPAIDWYPLDDGFHVAVNAGYAEVGQDNMTTGRGVGGSLAVGYDWRSFDGKDGETVRFGFVAQATAVRTTHDHAAVMPALLFTVGVD
jgi:hypothetical protein